MADPWDDPAPAAAPPPAAPPAAGDPWDEPAPAAAGAAPAQDGGLIGAIPGDLAAPFSHEGRAQLWEGIKQFPAYFAQSMLDFVKTPGTAYSEGITPEQEVEFSLNAALGTIGSAKFPRAVTEAIAPHVAEFDAGVMGPAAEQTTAAAMAPPPEMLNDIKARSGLPENVPAGEQGFTAYHGSPYSFDAFSMQKIGTGEGAQAYGHGLYFAENPSIAQFYKDVLGGASNDSVEQLARQHLQLAGNDAGKAAAQLRARAAGERRDPFSGINPDEMQAAAEKLEAGWLPNQGNLYHVRINADPEHFLDWDKPLSEQSEYVRNALTELGIDSSSDAFGRDILNVRSRGGVQVHFDELAGMDSNEISAELQKAGIPGVKYFDAGSRGIGAGSDLSSLEQHLIEQTKHLKELQETAGDLSGQAAAYRKDFIQNQQEAIERTKKNIEFAKNPTRNFVIFNEGDIQITHKNGEAVGHPILDNIIAAKQAGIIGPDIPPPPGETPAMSAQRAIPAASQPGDKVTMTPAGEPIDAWAERFNRYVDKTETPEDFKTLVKDMAAQNNNFPEARAGNVAPEQIAKVAEAAGLDAADIDAGKLRTTYRTDDEIRTVATLLKKLGDDVQSAAEAVRGEDSPENLAKFQAAIIKRDYALEATVQTKVALRAEWGRSGNALQSILKAENEQAGLTKVLQDKGRSIDDLRDMARGMNGLDREQAAKVLTGMRGQAPHWLYWMWTQGLISGPFTHVKYALANGLYAEMQRGVVTPLAAIIGKAKQLTGFADTDRVFLGEAAASHLGTIMAVPDAVKAAYQTIKTGMRVPLESEKQLHDLAIANGEKPSTALSRAVEPNLQPPRPIPGVWGRVFGAPGDSASAIHTTFKVLGERANLEALAYNKTAAEGFSHWKDPDAFNQRWQYHVNNATPEMLKDSVYQAYKDTFMQELGPKGQAWSAFVKNGVTINGQKVKIPGLRWAFPFNHIPINLMKATYEHTILAVLDKDMRANIMGENGGRQQDLAIARMMVGSSAMAYFAHKYMQGQATSNYPTDQNERKDWQLQGKIPNAIQWGDRWVSFERFGPAGDLAQLGANIGSIAHRFAMDRADPAKGTDEAFSHAIWATVNAAANTIGNEVGFQSLRNFMDAIEDEKKGGSFASYQATSLLPFSSLLSQTASFVDPHMRIAKGMVAALENRIPSLRETLLPKRDPLYGEPMPNPGYHDIIRGVPINQDPVKAELERVNLHPTAPRDVIGGVKLTPEQYDRYQATAGPLVQRALTSLVNHPGWQNIPLADRADTLRATISAMRQKAAQAMQIAEPKLIQQGLQQRLDYISGKTNTPRPKRPPEDTPVRVGPPINLGAHSDWRAGNAGR